MKKLPNFYRSIHFDWLLWYFKMGENCPFSDFSRPYFPAVWLNTEGNEAFLRILSKYGKIRTRKTPNMDTFHAVLGKLRTLIHPPCFMKKTLELLLYLAFKVELHTNSLRNISFLVLKSFYTWKDVTRTWVIGEFCIKNLELPIESSRLLLVMQ